MNFINDDIRNSVSKMILSASGWRTVFASSGDEKDKTTEITDSFSAVSALIGKAFCEWYKKSYPENKNPKFVVGSDSRPTGSVISNIVIQSLLYSGFSVEYVGITAAPEIMAYARTLDGFVYISASHNPIGHNGIKFGLNDGGVIDGQKAKVLIQNFKDLCFSPDAASTAQTILSDYPKDEFNKVLSSKDDDKKRCVATYKAFFKEVITASKDEKVQNDVFNSIKSSIKNNPIGVVADLNGSARTLSIDSDVFKENDIEYFTINNKVGEINHEIIPEPENLVYCADFMTKLQKDGKTSAKIGYMPDCDGDRGNIVYWSEDGAKILKAQEVFSLSVLSELSFMDYLGEKYPEYKSDKKAIAVNDPTSMRIEEIASAFNAKVARAEVGEANVVNLARKLRNEGYQVRILGEGSNGGTITYPAAVRDPINTVFALLKLLCIKDEKLENGKICNGLFHRWCIYSNQENLYKENFSLDDVVKTLPVYTTTGVSEPRAVLHIKTMDHGILKGKYQENFLKAWDEKKSWFNGKFGITSWRAFSNNGTDQTDDIKDFSLSAKGGLKIIFYNDKNQPLSFIWMRGSGTEPVFRVMCDVKGDKPEVEKELLNFHCELISLSDKN